MANPKPLQLPGPEYSGGEESLFRRKLANQLLELETRLDQAERRDGGVSSAASKRDRYIGVSIGQSDHGVLEPRGSYLTAYRDFSLGFLTRNITGFSALSAQQVWVADGDIGGTSPSISPWTSSVSSEWSDSATDGEFVYSGSDTRKFLITWHLNFWYFLKNQYTSLLGGVFLKPDGGAWPAAPIAGSAQISNLLYDYPLGLYYVYLKACSGGAVVEIENGDTVRFQFGFLCGSGTNTDGIVWLYGAGANSDAPGMSISIVPVT